jgi:hypothetical protein
MVGNCFSWATEGSGRCPASRRGVHGPLLQRAAFPIPSDRCLNGHASLRYTDTAVTLAYDLGLRPEYPRHKVVGCLIEASSLAVAGNFRRLQHGYLNP